MWSPWGGQEWGQRDAAGKGIAGIMETGLEKCGPERKSPLVHVMGVLLAMLDVRVGDGDCLPVPPEIQAIRARKKPSSSVHLYLLHLKIWPL